MSLIPVAYFSRFTLIEVTLAANLPPVSINDAGGKLPLVSTTLAAIAAGANDGQQVAYRLNCKLSKKIGTSLTLIHIY